MSGPSLGERPAVNLAIPIEKSPILSGPRLQVFFRVGASVAAMKHRVLGCGLIALAAALAAELALFVPDASACPPGFKPKPGVTSPTVVERDCEPVGEPPAEPRRPKRPAVVPPSVGREKAEQLLRERLKGDDAQEPTPKVRPKPPTDTGDEAIKRLGEKLRKKPPGEIAIDNGVPMLTVLQEPVMKPPCPCREPVYSGGIAQAVPNPCPKCRTIGQYAGLLQDAGPATVYLHSGEFFLHAADLEIPGRGFNWKFERKYRSGVISRGPLGRNWEFNYNRRLVEVTALNVAEVRKAFKDAKLGDVARMDGYGRADLYRRRRDGLFGSPTGFYTRLLKNPDGTFTERDSSGVKVAYGRRAADGIARMMSLTDRNGNTMRFQHNGQGRLTRVLDTLGRPIEYIYDAGGRLTEVRDFFKRSIKLEYDSNDDLVAVTSPAVTGTPNGNDFPQGKTVRYTYSSGFADERLNHNLLTVTAPNEVAADGPPRVVVTYEADPNSPNVDRVLSQTVGATNRTGVPAGGTIRYEYRVVAPPRPDDFVSPFSQTTVTDRNGNLTEYQFNQLGNIVRIREFTNRKVRPSAPEFFETKYEYNRDGELLKQIFPEGNSIEYLYDDKNSDRFQQGNLVAVIRRPDPRRGGDQAILKTTYAYEPIYNQIRSMTDARGHDPGYVPQNDGSNSPARYTTVYTFDYQEGRNFRALSERLGVSEAEVKRLLERAGIPMGVGDVNGDRVTDQVYGNIIRIQSPSVRLLPGSHQARVERETTQKITRLFAYNRFGQFTRRVDPEGNVDLYDYYPENDPDGDGGDLTPDMSPGPFGYPKQITRDAVDAPGRNSGTDPEPTRIRRLLRYDPVGNVIREVDGRGIATDYTINQLNQIVQIVRASAHDVFTPDPSEPLPLTDFRHLARVFYDFNSNVVLRQVEDRGNTSDVDGNPPAADLPSNVSDPDQVGGPAFVDIVYKYDILDHQIAVLHEVANGTAPEFLRTRYRYDPNGNRVLVIRPEGNATSFVYDERDLRFQLTRGATTPPPLALLAPGDPTNYDVRGGLPATTTSHYDGNRRLIERVDGADTDGSGANNSRRGGYGDRTRYIYDGFDRRSGVVDSVGNQTVFQYDPVGKVVRVSRFGPVGGASPTSDGPDVLRVPVSSGGDIRSDNLVSPHLLAAAERRYDELSRVFQTDRVLFVNTMPTVRPPDVADGAADIGKGNVTPGDDQKIPGITGITIIGRVSTRAEYDRSSRRTFKVEDDGDIWRYFYDGPGRMIKAVDPEGNTVELAYDAAGNVIETREIDASQVPGIPEEVFLNTYFYDSLNRLQRSVNNIGHTTDYRYDSRNNLVAMADAQGSPGPAVSRRRFTGGTLTVNATNRFGNVTRHFYDGIDRKIRQEVILTASGWGDGLSVGADIFGVKTAPPTPGPPQGGGDGIVRVGFNWDMNSLLSSRLDDQGNVTLYLYDNLDRRIVDIRGLTAQTAPLNKAKILGSRNVVTPTVATINAPAVISVAKIDAQLVAAKTSIDVVAPLFPSQADRMDAPTTVIYGYDEDGNLLILEDENGSKTFWRYDAINRRIAARIFRAGQADSHAGDPGFAPAPAGDLANPSAALSAIVGTTRVDFEYDGLSRLIRAADNNEPQDPSDDSVITYAYDSLSRVIEETQQVGALPAKVVSSSWRAEKLRSGVTYPQSGAFSRRLQYTYDTLDRLKTVADRGMAQAIAEYDYMGPWRVAQRRFPITGTRATYLNDDGTRDVGYDGLRRPVQQRHLRSNNSLIVGVAHTYDRMDDKLTEEKPHAPYDSELYGYDSAHRLVRFGRGVLNGSKDAVTVPSANVPFHRNWVLDGVGNWRQVDDEVRQHSSFNQVTRRTGGRVTTILSDNNGNVTDDGSLRLEWDVRNRLRRVTRKADAAPLAVYSYDAAQRRVRKVVTNSGVLDGTTYFYLDGWREIEERNRADAPLRQYVYGGHIDEPLALDRHQDGDNQAMGPGDRRLFYHQNTLYSVLALTDVAGSIAEGYHYDAYGRQTVFEPGANGQVDFARDDVITRGRASTVGNPYMFTGRRLDGETGLYYYRTRYFDPQLGRFISRDPIGERGGINLYEYVKSRPTRWGDPAGLGEFVVAGEPVAAEGGADETWGETIARKIGNWLEVMHVDIYHDNRQIRVGFGGGAQAATDQLVETDLSGLHQWRLEQVQEGTLRWGQAAGTPCCDAEQDDIDSCIRSAPAPRRCEYDWLTNNCQQDVEHAISGCCLTGYDASGFDPGEYNYMTDREREALRRSQEEALRRGVEAYGRYGRGG